MLLSACNKEAHLLLRRSTVFPGSESREKFLLWVLIKRTLWHSEQCPQETMVVTTASFIVLRCRLRAQCQGASMIYQKYFCGGQHAGPCVHFHGFAWLEGFLYVTELHFRKSSTDIILLTEVWMGTERQCFVVGLCNQCMGCNHFVLLLRAEPHPLLWCGLGGNQPF